MSVVGQAQTVLTDATGAFTLTDLAQGSVSLRVSKDGYVTQTLSSINVQAGAEAEVSSVAEPISLLRARGSLSGVATKLNDPNPGGVRVSVLGTSLTTFSNPEGGWSISGVPTGSYDLRFEAANFIAVTVNTVDVSAGADSTVNAQVLNPTLSAVVSGSLTSPLEAFDWGSTVVSLAGVNYPVSKSVTPQADGSFSCLLYTSPSPRD